MLRNVLLPETPGGVTSTEMKRPGAKRLGAETSWGQKEISRENGLGQISYMYLGATQKCSCLFTWSTVLCPIGSLTFPISGRMVRAHDSGAEGWPVQSR